MPLPLDGTISLLGSSRPGETSQSRPKQAMIIRMSEKTLDILESFPQLHFEFSDNPGVHIGDTFFPVTSVPELSPHDLYLRTSSAAKRNAPLKLYANLTGKFTVERQLDDRITGKVRASTVDAQNQRAGRTTIFVETPSNLPPPNGKRKKEPPMFMKKSARPPDQSHHGTSSSSNALPADGASTAPSSTQKSKEALQALRTRMIRCIAVAERTSDQVVKLVGGNDCSASTKRDILDLLEEIAEPIPLPNNSKAPKTFRLKTKSWLDVRPYELPGLTESERTNIARAAKLALRDLKIPESDPVWSHMQYRNPNGATPPSSTTRKQPASGAGPPKGGQASEPPKRGITSTAAKENKTKARNNSGEIMMKNESLKAPTQRPSASSSSRDEDSSRAFPPLKPPANRARPGSGFKRSPLVNGKPTAAEMSDSQDKDLSSSNSRRPPPSSQPPGRRPTAASYQKNEKPRGGEYPGSDPERPDRIRDRDRERAQKNTEEREEREWERRERDRERERRDLERERERERVRRRKAELENDRKHERVRKVRDKGREWSQEREEGEHSEDSLRPPKRKKTSREDEDYEDPSSRATQKRRKTDSPSRDAKIKDLGLPRRPEVGLAPRPKIIKEPSPLPPLPKIKKEPTPKHSALPAETSSSASSQLSSSKSKTGTKTRRKSPVFTSSEDEGEIRPPVKREPPATTVSALLGSNSRHNEAYAQSRSHVSQPFPTEHAALRARYNASYLDYVDTFQKLMKEKTKINNILSKNLNKMSAGSITDSDGDAELLDPDELRRLTSDYNRLHEELGGIRRILSGNRRTESESE